MCAWGRRSLGNRSGVTETLLCQRLADRFPSFLIYFERLKKSQWCKAQVTRRRKNFVNLLPRESFLETGSEGSWGSFETITGQADRQTDNQQPLSLSLSLSLSYHARTHTWQNSCNTFATRTLQRQPNKDLAQQKKIYQTNDKNKTLKQEGKKKISVWVGRCVGGGRSRHIKLDLMLPLGFSTIPVFLKTFKQWLFL